MLVFCLFYFFFFLRKSERCKVRERELSAAFTAPLLLKMTKDMKLEPSTWFLCALLERQHPDPCCYLLKVLLDVDSWSPRKPCLVQYQEINILHVVSRALFKDLLIRQWVQLEKQYLQKYKSQKANKHKQNKNHQKHLKLSNTVT